MLTPNEISELVVSTARMVQEPGKLCDFITETTDLGFDLVLNHLLGTLEQLNQETNFPFILIGVAYLLAYQNAIIAKKLKDEN